MAGTVGLLCASPLVRDGVCRILADGGWRVVEGDGFGPYDAVFVLVRSAGGVAEVVATRSRVADVPIVALTDDADLDLVTELLGAGATSVIPWESEPEAVLATLELARAGIAGVTTTTLTRLVEAAVTDSAISEAERLWLRHLARGITIAELAPIAGYSERSLYRQLNALYHRLGVHDRHGAIAEARRRGALGSDDGEPTNGPT